MQVGCATLQGAKQLFIMFIRKTRAVVPPAPTKRVVQIQTPEPRSHPIVQAAKPEGEEQPAKHALQPFLYFL